MRKRDHSSIQAPLPISYGSAYPKGAKTPRHFLNLLGSVLLYTTSLQLYLYLQKDCQVYNSGTKTPHFTHLQGVVNPPLPPPPYKESCTSASHCIIEII